MTAKVGYWSFNYDDVLYSWTAGRDYAVKDNGGSITVESDTGSGTVPKSVCNPDLFREVFGIDARA